MRQTINVFRVEHETKKVGPFHKASSEYGQGWGLDRRIHREYDAMPAPWVDGLSDAFPRRYRFAFPTLQAYVSFWKVSTLLDLQALGFVLREYSVNTRYCIIGESGMQVCYSCRAAKLVSTQDLLEPFNM